MVELLADRNELEVMAPIILSGSSHPRLAAAIARELGVAAGSCVVDRFPDGESRIELVEDVRGRVVYAVQSTSAPIGERLLELLLLSDVCHRGGCASFAAVIPYLGYARQDRRVTGREPLSARVIASQVESAGVERVITVDLHSAASEGCWRIPVEHVSAISLLAEHVRNAAGSRAVVVAPDLGAIKRAAKLAAQLGLPVAVVHKNRVGGAAIVTREILGLLPDRAPIIVDDVIATGETIEAAARALRESGCMQSITVAATHAVFANDAVERLGRLDLARIVVTDSVPPRQPPPALPTESVSLAALLADRIRVCMGMPRPSRPEPSVSSVAPEAGDLV